MKRNASKREAEIKKHFRMFLIPCSCGTSFAVAENYDRQGMHLRSFIPCPSCGKRHDPRNRLLSLSYQTNTSGRSTAADINCRVKIAD
jgi:hypothetical protein